MPESTLKGRATASGPAVRLRPVTEHDLDLLRRVCVEPELSGLSWFGFRDPGSVKRRLEQDGWLDEAGGRLIVEVDGAAAGFVSWHQMGHPIAKYPNVGIVLLPEFRGCGVGTAAQRLLCDYLFATRPYARIEAGTQVDNLVEQRALEKAGFTREGVLRHAHFQHGRWNDLVIYSRLREDPAPVD